MRYRPGNRFLFMMDEVTDVLYICLAVAPLLWLIIRKKNTEGQSCVKSLRFCFRTFIFLLD